MALSDGTTGIQLPDSGLEGEGQCRVQVRRVVDNAIVRTHDLIIPNSQIQAELVGAVGERVDLQAKVCLVCLSVAEMCALTP